MADVTPSADYDAAVVPEPYCLGHGPCLHALTFTCQSLGQPCERRTRVTPSASDQGADDE